MFNNNILLFFVHSGAASRCNCNSLGEGGEVCDHRFGRGFPVERFAGGGRSGSWRLGTDRGVYWLRLVEFGRNWCRSPLVVSLGPRCPVSGGLFPRRLVRMTQPDGDLQTAGKLGVTGHLRPAGTSHAFVQAEGQALLLAGKASQRRPGTVDKLRPDRHPDRHSGRRASPRQFAANRARGRARSRAICRWLPPRKASEKITARSTQSTCLARLITATPQAKCQQCCCSFQRARGVKNRVSHDNARKGGISGCQVTEAPSSLMRTTRATPVRATPTSEVRGGRPWPRANSHKITQDGTR